MFEFFAYKLIQYFDKNKDEYSESQKDTKNLSQSEDIKTRRENVNNCKC